MPGGGALGPGRILGEAQCERPPRSQNTATTAAASAAQEQRGSPHPLQKTPQVQPAPPCSTSQPHAAQNQGPKPEQARHDSALRPCHAYGAANRAGAAHPSCRPHSPTASQDPSLPPQCGVVSLGGGSHAAELSAGGTSTHASGVALHTHGDVHGRPHLGAGSQSLRGREGREGRDIMIECEGLREGFKWGVGAMEGGERWW